MTEFELRPEGADANARAAHQLVWPVSGRATSSVKASVGPWLHQLGSVSDTSVDFVRIAAAAYMADRLSPRRTGFSRTIRLHVDLIDSAPWGSGAEVVVDLLHWLTGDTWELSLYDDGLARPNDSDEPEVGEVVALLSGGLDSFCGALLAAEGRRVLIGHWDNPTVKAAQDRSWAWMRGEGGVGFDYEQIHLSQADQRREASNRSRSLLFVALAVAAADGARADLIEVPENGFTSLNPPLGADRGGALSTRSTHPWTLHLVRRLLAALGIGIQLADPHVEQTKGELLATTMAARRPSLREGAAKTLSCGKLDGRLYRGGNPNHHCGLCVPCLVRRGAFLAAGLSDDTPYLVDELVGEARQQLLERRSDDIAAVRHATARGLDDIDLMAMGPFPDDFNLDGALDLCSRGIRELAAVPLP